MRPEEPPRTPLEALLEDVEQQADALFLADRDAEVAELRRAEYAAVDLASRLHGSLGRRLVVSVTGPGPIEGVLARVGEGWLVLDTGAVQWLLSLSAVGSVRGLGERAVPTEARPVSARLGWGSVLRSLAEERTHVVLHRNGHGQVRGTLGRVGADFVEVRADADRADGSWADGGRADGGRGDGGGVETVPLAAVTAVRCG